MTSLCPLFGIVLSFLAYCFLGLHCQGLHRTPVSFPLGLDPDQKGAAAADVANPGDSSGRKLALSLSDGT